MKVISVFGSSRPQPGDPDYQLAYELGRQLAQAGFAVATGGYIGTMTAVSQGAAGAGGPAIGVTCDEIEAWRTVGPNAWITQEIRYCTLWERLIHLVTQNAGIVALPGGVGTLAEVALAWSQLQIGAMPPRPLILFDGFWRPAVDAIIDSAYVSQSDRQLLHFAATPGEAVAYLRHHIGAGDQVPGP
jgi:uncharacterized protein (TIGR00730 family)